MNSADRVQELGELELATLVCLVASQHCIVDADALDALDEAQYQLEAIASNIFGLSCATVDCSERLSVDDFSNAVLVESKDEDEPKHARSRAIDEPSYFSIDTVRPTATRHSRSVGRFNTSILDSRRVADVVIAKNLNITHHHVQIQALELIRGKRIFTRTAVHAAPKRFLFIALISSKTGGPLLSHLVRNPIQTELLQFDSTGLIETPYTDDPSQSFVNGKASGPTFNYPSSANETAQNGQHHTSSFLQNDIDELQSLAAAVRVTAEVRGYLHNVLTFLRAHRAVAGGVSATATRHLNLLVRALAPLHALSFVPPSLVALATRKVYSHRLVITAPENERSLQWGSSIEAVQELLDNVTVQDVIEEVLKTVEVPL
ncbi:MAG: hypothetical protein M1822_001795 [Bathelium mastoideum]|nr:MAG: hypothetical protein M1822_001795 [Bathelium mastoideum]